MTVWYNEPDPYAAAWLCNLIAAGHIAPGVVDERKIQDMEAWELSGFTQCHFFAGIGVWSYALRRAGWADERPIWTGSCPCQPFSAAGKQKGFSDERHLWPTWFGLIEQCKPAIVVGEQVASKDGFGWLDLVSTDLERADYAIAAADLCAAGFGQAHLRQRLYFVGLANRINQGSQGRLHRRQDTERENLDRYARCDGATGELADSEHNGSNKSERFATEQSGDGENGRISDGSVSSNNSTTVRNQGEIDRRWLDADWLLCRNPAGEPSWRPVESGTFPLAYGIAGRVGKLRAYGNALDAKTAQGFCEVVKEIVDGV